MSKSIAKRNGEELEHRILGNFNALSGVPDSKAEWHDAEVAGILYPESPDKLRWGGICLVEGGTPVEIKGAYVKTSNGSEKETPGRWYIKKNAHRKLVDAEGVYLLVVYSRGLREDQARIVVPATILDEHLRGRWYDAPEGRAESEVAQLAWPNILSECSVWSCQGGDEDV